jgi:hypothetical protein
MRSNLVGHEQDQRPVFLDKLQTDLRNHGICQFAFINAALVAGRRDRQSGLTPKVHANTETKSKT